MKKSLGHDRYPSGRKRPPSRTIATSSGVNREFHKKGLSYSPGIRGKFKKYRALRGLKQIDFASLALWSEMRCKKYLEAKGFFGVQWGRQCWRCQASLNQLQQDPALLRCSNRSCPALRPRILVWFHFLDPSQMIYACSPGLRLVRFSVVAVLACRYQLEIWLHTLHQPTERWT